MNKQPTATSIMRMASGAFEERVDYELAKVIENILDPNTKPDAKRKITLTIELTPSSDRDKIAVAVTAKSTLAPTNPVGTSLCITGDQNGEPVIAEMVPYPPGQMFLDGTEQEPPKILKLAGGTTVPVVFLPGWGESPGARLEKQYCDYTQKAYCELGFALAEWEEADR